MFSAHAVINRVARVNHVPYANAFRIVKRYDSFEFCDTIHINVKILFDVSQKKNTHTHYVKVTRKLAVILVGIRMEENTGASDYRG